MASATALTLINRVLSIVGDYSALVTVDTSPSGIAQRIINFLNIVLADISRIQDFPILKENYSAVGDGLNSQWQASTAGANSNSILSVVVGDAALEEKSPDQFAKAVAEDDLSGASQIYTVERAVTGELQVNIHPTPASGISITVLAYNDPTEFTLADASTTELTGFDDVLILGVLAQMDSYDKESRGYEQRYQLAKNKLYTHTNRNKTIRVTPEDYR